MIIHVGTLFTDKYFAICSQYRYHFLARKVLELVNNEAEPPNGEAAGAPNIERFGIYMAGALVACFKKDGGVGLLFPNNEPAGRADFLSAAGLGKRFPNREPLGVVDLVSPTFPKFPVFPPSPPDPPNIGLEPDPPVSPVKICGAIAF
jgi:hypothetical protein